MRLTKKIIAIAVSLFVLSQILFLINIQFPRGHNFDEFHYVPSAKQFLELRENQNWEHPPLGKLFMAAGIGLWGDRPIGWRYMSTVFGSLTLVGMYFLALALFESEETALWVVLITIVNQLLYVQSRIGMLDTFMFAFLVWAMAAYCAAWNPKTSTLRSRQYFAFSGLMFGLSTACKWFSFVPWMCCALLIAFIRVLQTWQTSFGKPTDEDWYRPQLWKGIQWPRWILYFGVIPLAAYFATFLPYLLIPGHGLSDFIPMQFKMWDGQLRVVTSHPYMSRWLDWPLLNRPIWYAYDREGDKKEWVRGVLLLGNPLIMWGGLIALLDCIWSWITLRSRKAFLIVFFYFVFLGCWVVIPRKISFYYYYYPAGMVLSLALAYVFHHRDAKGAVLYPWARWVFLGTSLCLFIYFFPILSGLKIPADSFRSWMWFQSWI